MSNSVRPHRQQPTRLPHPWDSPGKNTGVGCHFLLQEKSKCSQKRNSLKNISGLFSRILTVQEREDNIFKLMEKKKAYHPRILFSGRLFFINEDDIKTFPNEQQLRGSPTLGLSYKIAEGSSSN